MKKLKTIIPMSVVSGFIWCFRNALRLSECGQKVWR